MTSVTRMNPLQTAIVSALNIDLVYLCQDGSREQVILDVLLVPALVRLLTIEIGLQSRHPKQLRFGEDSL